MLRHVCRAKIKNAVITGKNLNYSGSIGIDKRILEACDICANEMVQVLNMNNANRFETYVIEEKAGSGKIALYGPAARLGEVGDTVVILATGIVDSREIKNHKIKLASISNKNRTIK